MDDEQRRRRYGRQRRRLHVPGALLEGGQICLQVHLNRRAMVERKASNRGASKSE